MTVYAALKTPYIKYTGVNSATSGTAATVIARYPLGTVASQVIDPVTGDITLTGVYNQQLVIPFGHYVYGWGDIDSDRSYEPVYFETNYIRYTDPLPVGVQTVTLYSAVGQVNLPAMLLGGSTSVAVTWDKTMPSSIVAADVHWRAHAGVQVLSQVALQAIASPIVPTTTGCTFFVRATGLASVAGILQAEVQKLVTT